MLHDFDVVEIPTDDGYVHPTMHPPAAISTWHSVLTELEKILRCVKYGEPGWGSDGIKVDKTSKNDPAPIGVFMWGRTSGIAQKYLERNFNRLGPLDAASSTA